MNNSRQWILAAAGFLALSLWVGTASADGTVESTTTPSTLEDLNNINNPPGASVVGELPPPGAGESSAGESTALVDPEDSIDVGGLQGSGPLGAISTGNSSASMVANSDPDAIIAGNSIGDNSTTGDVGVYSANTGGINVNFANSGNNVVMQNSMAVNIYLGPQQ
jgi:hypothetical protein